MGFAHRGVRGEPTNLRHALPTPPRERQRVLRVNPVAAPWQRSAFDEPLHDGSHVDSLGHATHSRRYARASFNLFDRLRELGYAGGLTSVKDYIRAHRHLVPASRALAAGSPNRGRRFGVPYSYEGMTCRVCREGGLVRIGSSDCHAMKGKFEQNFVFKE